MFPGTHKGVVLITAFRTVDLELGFWVCYLADKVDGETM